MVSPLYPHEFHQGVLCIWNLFTNKTHTISIHISDIDLGPDNHGCEKHALLVESDKIKKKICTKTSDIRLEDSDVRIVFQTKLGTVGKGFSLLVKTVGKIFYICQHTLNIFYHSVYIWNLQGCMHWFLNVKRFNPNHIDCFDCFDDRLLV